MISTCNKFSSGELSLSNCLFISFQLLAWCEFDEQFQMLNPEIMKQYLSSCQTNHCFQASRNKYQKNIEWGKGIEDHSSCFISNFLTAILIRNLLDRCLIIFQKCSSSVIQELSGNTKKLKWLCPPHNLVEWTTFHIYLQLNKPVPRPQNPLYCLSICIKLHQKIFCIDKWMDSISSRNSLSNYRIQH